MIRITELTKRYGKVAAVQNVSFEVPAGRITGFLGPNGAGKSTVLKTLSTWLPPTSGKVEVAGHDVVREPLAVRRSLGYLPEHNSLYDSMVVLSFLEFTGSMHGLSGSALAARIEWATASLNLQDVLQKRIQQCSKGYRQRIGLAAALLHDPRVILLDEPTHGLDPLQVVAFRDFVRSMSAGRAILFSSHVLAEVMAICEHVLIINQGKLLADMTVVELQARAKREGLDAEAVVLNIVESEGGKAQALRGGARAAEGATK